MIPRRIEGATRQLAKDQEEYATIWVKDWQTPEGWPVMSCAFEPTPDELAKLMAGGSITLHVLGRFFQPVHITVGEPPE